MKTADPIIFDYRYDNEENGELYQLVVGRSVTDICNTLLFHKFYELLTGLLQPGRESIYINDLSPALEYHYWKFAPRFAFVNVIADQYEQTNNAGQLANPLVNAFLEYWLDQKGTNSSIYESTIRLAAVVDEEMSIRRDIPVGTPYTYIPEPVNNLEAFQRLKFLMGPQVCEYHIREFQNKYKEANAEIYASELAPINSFVDNIDHRELKKAFEHHDDDHAREYLRITNGYYDNHRCEQAMGNTASIVYGKYILYKEWLEKRLRESFSNKKARGLPQLEPGKVSPGFILDQSLFNMLYQRGLLSDFFLVPAPPVKGRFWYDINDKDTDNPAKVVRVSPISIRQKRQAKSEEFQIVLDQVNIINDKNSKAYKHFIDDLIECIHQMLNFHRTLHKPEERGEDHYHLIELAEKFIDWIRSENNPVIIAVEQPIKQQLLFSNDKDVQILDDLKKRTEDLPDILHLRAYEVGYEFTEEDKVLVMDTYSKLDDILKEVAAFINVRFPGQERHVRAWNNIDFDTKIGNIKIRTNDREHIKREWRNGMFDLISLIKVLRNETVLIVNNNDTVVPASKLKDISSEYPLEYYTNKEVIPNQDLVSETISFFEVGKGKGIFTAIDVLNLINKQQEFLMLNYNNGDFVIQHFNNLPLNDRQKHSLYGFLLKWFGGYPVNNLNDELNETLKLIQAEFLKYRDDTPEKIYCKADQGMRNRFEKYGIAFTTAINHGIDVSEILAAMDHDIPNEDAFHNFPELFTAMVNAGLIHNYKDRKDFLIAQSATNYQFNVWLQEYMNWEFRNEVQYKRLLTKNIFKNFLACKAGKTEKSINNVSITTPSPTYSIDAPVLTIKQVALICHYTDCIVTRATANIVVEKYGHSSGDKLFNEYSHYRSKANRTGAEATIKKNANKLQLFESVEIYLQNDKPANNRINADLQSLRAAIEKANLTL